MNVAGADSHHQIAAGCLLLQELYNIIHRRQLREADDVEAESQRLIDDYEDRFNNPYVAAERGYIDDVIEALETRPRLIRALEMLRNKREATPPRKHGNIPL